ncbi:MAG: glycosyl transferase, partial [Nocardia sp.]|nr:glycosyl transferase [Nocardia sp.]
LATERIIRYARISTTDIRPAVWFAALALALIPLVPTALPVTERGYTPQFFTDGTVRQFVDHGSVVVVPPPTRLDARPLNWQIDSGFSFPLAGGYFVGPDMYGKGRYGPDDRRTSIMLMRAQRSNRVQPVDEAAKARARADLAYWHADVLVLTQIEHGTAVRETLDHLLGISGRVVDGVFVWDVRSLR